jgi:hypothetical protein
VQAYLQSESGDQGGTKKKRTRKKAHFLRVSVDDVDDALPLVAATGTAAAPVIGCGMGLAIRGRFFSSFFPCAIAGLKI